MNFSELATAATRIAHEAGEAIMAIYAGPFEARRKYDKSPVTEADLAAEAIIVPALQRLTPDIPIISEESYQEGAVDGQALRSFWLVDPLDGTKEFIARNGDFTVNIALIEDKVAALGIVHIPALSETYRGWKGQAERSRNGDPFVTIHARKVPQEGSVMIVSRSHADKERERLQSLGERIDKTLIAGSSLKFCRVAEGMADLYPRFGTTMEWDTAAGHAILTAAGGSVRVMDGHDLAYAKPGFRNPSFIARGAER